MLSLALGNISDKHGYKHYEQTPVNLKKVEKADSTNTAFNGKAKKKSKKELDYKICTYWAFLCFLNQIEPWKSWITLFHAT